MSRANARSNAATSLPYGLVVARRVHLLQHAEKEPEPGDPGINQAGREQARRAAEHVASSLPTVTLWASPLRRARETAAMIAARLGVPVHEDDRLRERMNWEGPEVEPLDRFLTEWARSTGDRAYVPSSGDSSAAAADRFLAALDDIAADAPPGEIVVVAHGGVTVDALRTLLGDEELRARDETLLDDGVPSCAITTLTNAGREWTVVQIASTAHLG
jgi:broad specificity phosphatase PhoE